MIETKNYIQELEQELAPEIAQILDHPFIHRLEDGWLNRRQLQFFTGQYYLYCFHFPAFLSACAANVPDDDTRMAIIENLWEEHGEGDINKSHRTLYLRFAQSIGMTEQDLIDTPKLSTTQICVENLLALCKHDHFLVSLGALGPGTEYFTNQEYIKIQKGLRTYDDLSEEAIFFWTAHISLDEDHYADMMAPVTKHLNSQESYALLRKGARRAIELEKFFWDGLENSLPEK